MKGGVGWKVAVGVDVYPPRLVGVEVGCGNRFDTPGVVGVELLEQAQGMVNPKTAKTQKSDFFIVFSEVRSILPSLFRRYCWDKVALNPRS
jgi:hypothetical protein